MWLFFWICFALVAEPFNPHPQGAHVPVSPITVWGYSIGLVDQLEDYLFVKVVFTLEMPSALLVGLVRNLFFKNVTRDWMFAGIDLGAYVIILTMIVSFLQWYAIGRTLKLLILVLKRAR